MTHRQKLPALAAVALLSAAWPAGAGAATVLHNDHTVQVQQTLPDPDDSWVLPEDLTRINSFVLKGDAICLDDLCVPVRQNSDSALLITRSGRKRSALGDRPYYEPLELPPVGQQRPSGQPVPGSDRR